MSKTHYWKGGFYDKLYCGAESGESSSRRHDVTCEKCLALLGLCPKCQGVSGFETTRTVRYQVTGTWDGQTECGDSTRVSQRKTVTCIDCGKTFKPPFSI